MPERWLGVDNHAALLPTPPHPAAVEHPDATNAPKSHPLEEEGGLMLTVSNAVDGVKTPISTCCRFVFAVCTCCIHAVSMLGWHNDHPHT